jgi:hypothetical protein
VIDMTTTQVHARPLRSNFAVLGFFFGLIAFFICLVPLVGAIVGIIAIGLSVIAIIDIETGKRRGMGYAAVGTIFGLIAAVVGLIIAVH